MEDFVSLSKVLLHWKLIALRKENLRIIAGEKLVALKYL